MFHANQRYGVLTVEDLLVLPPLFFALLNITLVFMRPIVSIMLAVRRCPFYTVALSTRCC